MSDEIKNEKEAEQSSRLEPVGIPNFVSCLSAIASHEEVERLRGEGSLDEKQENLLLDISNYFSIDHSPDDFTPRDVVLLSRHFKSKIGPGSDIGSVLDGFSAAVLDNPDSYNEYAEFLVFSIHLNKYRKDSIEWANKAYEAGNVKACYDLALMLMDENPRRSADLLKEFIEDCKDSDQYDNDNSRFEEIYVAHYEIALEEFFQLAANPSNKDLYDKEAAKKVAGEIIELGEFVEEFKENLGRFVEYLFHEENDDEGFRLLLEMFSRLNRDWTIDLSQVSKNMNDLDAKYDGVISRILDADEDGEFTAIARAMRDELGQSDDPGFDNFLT